MGDAQWQVSSSNKNATLTNNVMLGRKWSNQETILSVHHWSTLILQSYGADQKHLTQKFNEAVLVTVIDYTSWWTTV